MGYRRKAREFALQMLYQYDVSHEFEHLIDEFWSNKDVPDDVKEFAGNIVEGVIKAENSIDEMINRSAENWSIDRMAVVDRNIMRIATYEFLYIQDIPVKVTINEAIEIAKRFGGEESGSFINGILDRIVKDNKDKVSSKL